MFSAFEKGYSSGGRRFVMYFFVTEMSAYMCGNRTFFYGMRGQYHRNQDKYSDFHDVVHRHYKIFKLFPLLVKKSRWYINFLHGP